LLFILLFWIDGSWCAELSEVEAARLCCESFSRGYKFKDFTNTKRSWNLFTSTSARKFELNDFTINWRRRGKKLKAICTGTIITTATTSIDIIGTTGTTVITVNISLSQRGQILICNKEQIDNKRVDCFFERSDGICIGIANPQANFVKLEILSGCQYEDDNGPDPVLQPQNFWKHLNTQMTQHPQFLDKPICELMYNQKLFNGIGNYLRSEILHNVGIPPFTSTKTVFTNRNLWRRLLRACRTIPMLVIKQISSQFKWYDDKEHQEWMKSFLQVYGKSNVNVARDSTNKKIWFSGEAGELYSEDNHKVKDRKFEKVGPWSGWDETVKDKFLAINIPDSLLQLCHRALPEAHRPAIIKTMKRGRPMISRPNKNSKSSYSISQYDDRTM